MIPLVYNKTSHIEPIFIRDTTVTNKIVGLSGLVWDTPSLVARRHVVGSASSSAVTLEDATTQGDYEAPSDGNSMRFKEIDATNLPGWYELHFHDSWLATKGRWGIRLSGAANMEDAFGYYEVQNRLHGALGSVPTDIPNETTGELWDWAKVAYMASVLGYEIEPGATPKQITLFRADGTTPLLKATLGEGSSPIKITVGKLGPTA